ncbi:MAG: type IV pilin protein [Xanthomonadales bacterium]
MNTWKVKKHSGFSMIELMIVIVIVAILVSLAYPSYIQYVRKSKRGEAQQLLMNWSINQEIWRSNNPLYASTGNIAAPIHEHYDFNTVGTPTATAYVLVAAAKSGDDQLNDKARDGTACSTLNLDDTGKKYSAGDDTIAVCWD